MELLITGITSILRIDVFCALFIGALGGILIGAIPGVGPAVAIAILLPATFSLDPLVGLTLLLGIYGASMYGGAIPAILINTPGTPVNALTCYDGYALTQKGQASKALSLAYCASFFGGIFSVICLIATSPLIAKVAPLFGSRDIFMAALLGAVLVIISHRGQSLAAGMLLFFGIFLNTIGLEPIRYSQRFTFDQQWLSPGINLIVVLLGIFALSQALILLTQPHKPTQVLKIRGSRLSGFVDIAKNKITTLFSAIFGVIMGIIPGVGEFLAQFFAYSLAQKLSKKPEQFGRGSCEGLIASETANNAVPAAAMIPLLALGIPGEALTAMMLSVFYVHGIIPGPALFHTKPDFLISLYTCLFFINLLILVFLLITSRHITKVLQIPTRFIGMGILTLTFVGVYSLRNSAIDCIICGVFGFFGYLLKRLNLPLVPLILGMVLGDIMDQKFRASLARIETPLDFIERPIAAILFSIIIVSLLLHLFDLHRRKNRA